MYITIQNIQYYTILPQIDDVLCYNQTHLQTQVKNRQPSTILQNSTPNWQAISRKHHEILAMIYSRNQTLRSCSGILANMLLKRHLGIKHHTQYNKVIRLLQYSSANS